MDCHQFFDEISKALSFSNGRERVFFTVGSRYALGPICFFGLFSLFCLSGVLYTTFNVHIIV